MKKLTCNIDKRGRLVRLIAGTSVNTCGAALIVAAYLIGSPALTVFGVLTIMIGTFVIVEGALGWCVFRAMGIKTRF